MLIHITPLHFTITRLHWVLDYHNIFSFRAYTTAIQHIRARTYMNYTSVSKCPDYVEFAINKVNKEVSVLLSSPSD